MEDKSENIQAPGPTPETKRQPMRPRVRRKRGFAGNGRIINPCIENNGKLLKTYYYRHGDLDQVPSLLVDEDGLPVRPVPLRRYALSLLTEAQRKVYFVLQFNYYAGNVTLALQAAGAARTSFERWRTTDQKFVMALSRAQDQITDRMVFRLTQLIGVCPCGPKGPDDANAQLLAVTVRQRRPALFAEEFSAPYAETVAVPDSSGADKANGVAHTIPRPETKA